MNSLRIARAALRARPAAIRVPLQRRTYADAVPDKIKLSLSLPHQKVANGSGSEQDIAEAKIELEVLESLQANLK
ncbi:ATP synthase subunit delta like protein [Verticillium longisporum]|nr:ATP synthase subunit delta like protein [Verticillium longisporum]